MLPKKLQSEYKLIKSYKEGGQSFTFLVQKGEDRYIVKIPKTDSLSKDRRFRLEREVKALELMNGVGVPMLRDYSIEDEIYIVMDFIDGLTLDEYISKTEIGIEKSVSIITALSDTVEQAHKLGLYHRDLKPNNIIIENKTNRPIVIDFGICWMRDDLANKTNKGIELGNRFLRLPELAKGTDVTVSSSDITFIVGLLFYLTTKKQPYILLNEYGLLPHKREEVGNLDILSNRVLQEIFDKGFTYEVSLRYSTAQELKEDLKKILLPMLDNKGDSNAKKKLDEVFSDRFYIKRRANIEIIEKCHQKFIDQYRLEIHKSLGFPGNGPNFNEKTRAVETHMFLLQMGTSEPIVRFYLNSHFNESFDVITASFGSENFSDQVTHTIKETVRMESIYKKIAQVLSENTMNELLPKIQEGLK